MGFELGGTFSLRLVEAGDIVVELTLHGVVRSDIAYRTLDILDPFGAISLVVLVEIQRDDLVLKH